MKACLDLTPEQRAALEPLLAVPACVVLATVHKHRPFEPGMPAEKVGAPVVVCGTVPASALPKLRRLIEQEQKRGSPSAGSAAE